MGWILAVVPGVGILLGSLFLQAVASGTTTDYCIPLSVAIPVVSVLISAIGILYRSKEAMSARMEQRLDRILTAMETGNESP